MCKKIIKIKILKKIIKLNKIELAILIRVTVSFNLIKTQYQYVFEKFAKLV